MFIIKKINPEDTLAIRHTVLWPSKPIEFCILPDDKKGIHYGGFFDEKLISVASIFLDKDSARLRKFATVKEFQGKGYGSTIINKIIEDLQKGISTESTNASGIKPVVTHLWCDARLTAEGFYNRFLMNKKGNVFLKSEVEYIVMQRELTSSL